MDLLNDQGVLYAALGLAALAAALLPRLLGKVPVSMPMVFVGAGVLAFTVVPSLPTPDLLSHLEVGTHLAELCVIVSLMGAGLALDRPVGWRRWGTTWRLLTVSMVASILIMVVLSHYVLGFGLAAALLLAATLAPTDPVLASEVQVAEPSEDPDEPPEDEARFALTSEAGLNDSLAFPFVYAAIALAAAGTLTVPVSLSVGASWLAVDLGWRLSVGCGIGLAIGWLLRKLFFHNPVKSLRLAENAEGFVALAATLLAYGVAEALHGYGFLAVFICACMIKASERSHGSHLVLHQWVEQLERLLTVLLLILLGGALARGMLASLQPIDYVVVALFLLVVRPLAGWLGLLGGRTGRQERSVIAFFGVRGIGSIYYIAFALGHGHFDNGERLWAIVGLTITASILVHGVTATPVMAWLDRSRQRTARRRGTQERASETRV